jgi:hypothetical protein
MGLFLFVFADQEFHVECFTLCKGNSCLQLSLRMCVSEDILPLTKCTFLVALITVAELRNQLRYLSADKWIRKRLYIHNWELFKYKAGCHITCRILYGIGEKQTRLTHMWSPHLKKRHENRRGSTLEEKLYQHQWKEGQEGVTGCKIGTVCGVYLWEGEGKWSTLRWVNKIGGLHIWNRVIKPLAIFFSGEEEVGGERWCRWSNQFTMEAYSELSQWISHVQ